MNTTHLQERLAYRQHAVSCGIDMRGRLAVPCSADSAGCIIAVPPMHPETQAELVPEGFSLTGAECETLRRECGLDYLIVDAARVSARR